MRLRRSPACQLPPIYREPLIKIPHEMSHYSGDPKAFDTTSFNGSLTGECLCGNIKVTISNKPNPFKERNGHQCFCSNCRKITGCAGSNNMDIESENVPVSVPKGFLKTYQDSNTGSGKMTSRPFCSNCSRYDFPISKGVRLGLTFGIPIYALPTDDPELFYVLPLGIFLRIPAPEFELFATHKHDWQAKNEGVKRYKFMSSRGELD